LIIFPNCKVNLGLNILNKRPDGYHNLQTVFYPVRLQDALEIITEPEPAKTAAFTVSGIALDIKAEDNICAKAYALLKKDFPQLPAIRLHLHKVIPSGAGLGGGSADGAAALLLLNKKYGLGLSGRQLMDYALQLGSDCPFFVVNKPCFATGRGEVLAEIDLDLSAYKIVIVNPGIYVSTAAAFAGLQVNTEVPDMAAVISGPVEAWKDNLTNDFEAGIFAQYPEIRAIKEQLYSQGAVYASMSGTGSTVYGIFRKEAEVLNAFPSSCFFRIV
jgi:4-diphosphocytidyl-2-C-methyl-D-erythritol kinase